MVPYLLFDARFDWPQHAAGAGIVVLSNVVFLGLIERHRWAEWVELLRGPLLAGAVTYLASVWFSGWTLIGLGAGTLVVMWASWNAWRARARAAAAG